MGLRLMCNLAFLPPGGEKLVPQIRGVFLKYDPIHTKN
jgi:hypothetical protein